MTTGTVLLHDPRRSAWLLFTTPRAVHEVTDPSDLPSLLDTLERDAAASNAWIAGFLTYESAPAFDEAFTVRPPAAGTPVAWLGLYDGPREITTLPKPSGMRSADISWAPSIERQPYGDAVASIRNAIARGETYQVNFTLRMRGRFDGDAYAFFHRLSTPRPSPYAAYVDTGRFVVCSASPELFFILDGDMILSRPMKGTAPRGLTADDDRRRGEELHGSVKDRAENVMIVDMVRNDLGRIAEPGSVHVPDLYTLERYPTVWQMTSSVTARTRAPLSRLFGGLYPPASITGAPKIRTMRFIRDLEDSPRGVYTGSVGWFGPGRQAQFNVAIRTVVVDRSTGTAEYGVGSGIVWDSIADAEYDECLTKARILTETSPDFDLLETMLWTPEGGAAFLDDHLARMHASADYFAFPWDDRAIRAAVDGHVRVLERRPHRVRLRLTRAGAPLLASEPLAPAPLPLPRVGLTTAPVDPDDRFLYHKTTHRKIYERALAEAPGFDDVVLLNTRGEVTESCSANIVVELDGHRVTPPVRCGLLPGVYRSVLLTRGEIAESVVTVHDLRRATRVWLINSVRLMYSVRLDLDTHR